MADYKVLLRRAVEALPENNGAQRRAVYEEARAALVGQLRAINPPLAARDITAHRLQLEDCIRQVEQEVSEAVIAGLGSSKEEAPPPPVPSIGEIIAALEGGLAAQPHPADYAELLRRSVEALPEIIAALEEELASPQTEAEPRPAGHYRELLRRAIEALPENNGAARRAVYEMVRGGSIEEMIAAANAEPETAPVEAKRSVVRTEGKPTGKPVPKLVPGTGVRTQIAPPRAAAPPPTPIFEEPELEEELPAPPTAAQPRPMAKTGRPLPSIVARAEAAKSRIGPTAFGAPIGGAPNGPELSQRRELSVRGIAPVSVTLVISLLGLAMISSMGTGGALGWWAAKAGYREVELVGNFLVAGYLFGLVLWVTLVSVPQPDSGIGAVRALFALVLLEALAAGFWVAQQDYVDLDAIFGRGQALIFQSAEGAASLVAGSGYIGPAFLAAILVGVIIFVGTRRAKRSGGRNPKPRQQRKPPPVATTAHPRSANVETDRGTMLDALRHSFSRLSRFDGRASRSEFWLFTLFFVLAVIVSRLLDIIIAVSLTGSGEPIRFIGIQVISLFLFIPHLSVCVRRFHDMELSARWVFPLYIPLFVITLLLFASSIGSLFIVVIAWILFFCIFLLICVRKGSSGHNMYGEPPRLFG